MALVELHDSHNWHISCRTQGSFVTTPSPPFFLNMHDGFGDEGWLKEFKNRMVDTFSRENLFSVLVPAGNEIDKVCFKCTLYMSYGFS